MVPPARTRSPVLAQTRGMPRRFTGKLLRFLFKHLELGTFGERLLWLDRQAGIFQMLWRHGNGCSTTPDEDSAVFMAWHEEKMRRKPCDAAQAKQRFRIAANKMRLVPINSWRGCAPGRHFQFRQFPPEDLDFLLRHADLDQDRPPRHQPLPLACCDMPRGDFSHAALDQDDPSRHCPVPGSKPVPPAYCDTLRPKRQMKWLEPQQQPEAGLEPAYAKQRWPSHYGSWKKVLRQRWALRPLPCSAGP